MNGTHSLIQTYTEYSIIDSIPGMERSQKTEYDSLCTRDLIVEGDWLVRDGLYVNSGSTGRVSFSLTTKLPEK